MLEQFTKALRQLGIEVQYSEDLVGAFFPDEGALLLNPNPEDASLTEAIAHESVHVLQQYSLFIGINNVQQGLLSSYAAPLELYQVVRQVVEECYEQSEQKLEVPAFLMQHYPEVVLQELQAVADADA